MPKYTGDHDQYLDINNKNSLISADNLILPNSVALHTHPRYYGEDALIWRPSRWIVAPAERNSDGDVEFSIEESLLVPMQGAFVLWSEGARIFPGKKFAQVEFVAVIAAHHVQPIVHFGERADHARQRILDMVTDSNVGFLLQIRNPTSLVGAELTLKGLIGISTHKYVHIAGLCTRAVAKLIMLQSEL